MIKQEDLEWRLRLNCNALKNIDEFALNQIWDIIWETRELINHILLWGYTPNKKEKNIWHNAQS